MKALWLEGGKRFAAKIQQELGAKGVAVTPVDDIVPCLEALKADREAVVVIDLDLYRKGVGAVQEIRKNAPNAPVIVLASLERLPVVDEAFKHGAWDSVIKQLDMSHLYEIPRALARCEEKRRLRAEVVKFQLEVRRCSEEAKRLQSEMQQFRSSAEKIQAEAERHREMAQTQLHEDESGWLGMVLQACPEGIFGADAESRLIFSNAALRDALGYGEEELIGKGINTFAPSLRADEGSWTRVPLPYPQRRWQGKLEFKKKDGSALPMTTRIVQALDGKGATKSTVAVCLTRAEAEPRPALKLPSAAGISEDLLSEIIDDVQTPLAAMLGYLQIVSMISPDQAEPNQILAIKRTELVARRLLDLVVSHIGARDVEANRLEIHKSPLEIDQIVESALEAKRSEASIKNIEIAVDVADGLPPIPIDGVQMERAIGILLSHAINLSPLGGSVTVSGRLNGNELALAFTDTGSGFSPEEIPLLFKKRTKLRRPGGDINSVGLYLAHEIVSRHGGRVDVKSDPMEGTTITVFLPR